MGRRAPNGGPRGRMRYLEQTDDAGHDIHLEPFQGEVLPIDEWVFNKAAADSPLLLQIASRYLGEVVDLSRPLFEGGLVLSAVNIVGVAERTYQIELECYFERDDAMIWSITFNFPLTAATLTAVEQGDYWPIEFKRYVE